MSIKIALAQTASTFDAQDNLDVLMRIAQEAARSRCAAVCFPEASLTGYAPEQAASLALEGTHPLLDRLARCAQENGIDILAGYMERRGDEFYLTHGLFRADAARAAYRKTHLGEKEARFFAAGDSLDVFALSCGLKAGFQLCVETHFPEITQTLSLRGAQVIFAPHAAPGTPEKRRSLWQTYIPARAYDNRVYVACCNQRGGRYSGGCYAAGPRGEVLADDFSCADAYTVFEADEKLLESFRTGEGGIRSRYYPGQRRPKLYG